MTKEMDCCTDETATTQSQGRHTIVRRARSWIVTPRGLTLSGITVVATGLALNWSWLVAAGIAPTVLSLAPCAVMCALGLCMGMGQRSAPSGAKPGNGSEANAAPRPSTQADGVPS